MIRVLNLLLNYHSYPVIMETGGIKELTYYNGRYFDSNMKDVSNQVSYKIIVDFKTHTRI